ncbi:VanZ family protein [uncultured Phycicoccus sp.]|uniref:VanZ family protein n=1 Tax=uncultured Phycicoccus sp. TaxID=661422 RepID=UPI002630443F|nr:VanZ family protein [uncultured Phycicoccus sp.]
MTTPGRGARRRRPLLLGALGAALLVQVVVLYAPQGTGDLPFPHADKVVHLVVFFVPALLALAARLPARAVVALLAVHAVVSEVVQGVVLAGRSGDPLDALADLAGVALAAGVWWLRRASGRGPVRW